jgi:hypothetical protein
MAVMSLLKDYLCRQVRCESESSDAISIACDALPMNQVSCNPGPVVNLTASAWSAFSAGKSPPNSAELGPSSNASSILVLTPNGTFGYPVSSCQYEGVNLYFFCIFRSCSLSAAGAA